VHCTESWGIMGAVMFVCAAFLRWQRYICGHSGQPSCQWPGRTQTCTPPRKPRIPFRCFPGRQVYGLPVPDWAADASRVVAVAAGVAVTGFVPRENVKIETGGQPGRRWRVGRLRLCRHAGTHRWHLVTPTPPSTPPHPFISCRPQGVGACQRRPRARGCGEAPLLGPYLASLTPAAAVACCQQLLGYCLMLLSG
jgi:hypothetical protein